MSTGSRRAANVCLRFSKWDGAAHWRAMLELQGEDEYGAWLGGRAGLTFTRPGVSFETTAAQVVLLPHDRAWVATFYESRDCGADDPDPGPLPPPGSDTDVLVYVDMTTPPQWSEDGSDVTMVDLDLDVFQRHDGSIHVDDEDEFAVHQVEMAYPPEIIALAERSRDEVLFAIQGGVAPFDEVTHLPWLAKLA